MKTIIKTKQKPVPKALQAHDSKRRAKPVFASRMIKGGLIIVAAAFTGCTSTLGNSEFFMSGTPEGIKSFSDWQTATITETRKPAADQGAYWHSREKETELKGLRFRVIPKKKGK